MGPIVVYTAVTKTYDILKPPADIWRRDAAFVAFVDDDLAVDGWSYRPLEHLYSDPCRNAKIMKILPHRYFPEAEFTVWMDGSIEIISKDFLREVVLSALHQHDLALFKHRTRDCIYAEAEACIASGKDCPEIIRAQVKKYRNADYPEKNGLAECTVLIRRNTGPIREFSEAWYREIEMHSRRDQLSFNYVIRETGVNYNLLPGLISNNPHFRRRPHLGASQVKAG